MKAEINRFLQALLFTMLITLCPYSLLGCNQCNKQEHQKNPYSWQPTKEQKEQLNYIMGNIDKFAQNGGLDKAPQNKTVLSGIALFRWKMGAGKKFEKKIQNTQLNPNLKDELLKYIQEQFSKIVNS